MLKASKIETTKSLKARIRINYECFVEETHTAQMEVFTKIENPTIKGRYAECRSTYKLAYFHQDINGMCAIADYVLNGNPFDPLSLKNYRQTTPEWFSREVKEYLKGIK